MIFKDSVTACNEAESSSESLVVTHNDWFGKYDWHPFVLLLSYCVNTWLISKSLLQLPSALNDFKT